MANANTIRPGGISIAARILPSALSVLLAGCQVQATPPCPRFENEDFAPSAGCLALREGTVLVIQDFRGRLSPPGGASDGNESAQCTAFRETWEETGLSLTPDRLLDVFDTGFHLYLCQHHTQSGDIDPPPRLEVRDAFYLSPADFDQWEWRFPGQQLILKELAEREIGTADQSAR